MKRLLVVGLWALSALGTLFGAEQYTSSFDPEKDMLPILNTGSPSARLGFCAGMVELSEIFWSKRQAALQKSEPPVPQLDRISGHIVASQPKTQGEAYLRNVGGLLQNLAYKSMKKQSVFANVNPPGRGDTSQQTLDKVKAAIQANKGMMSLSLAPIEAGGVRHRVVVYGYEKDNQGNIRFKIADPNAPPGKRGNASLVPERGPGGSTIWVLSRADAEKGQVVERWGSVGPTVEPTRNDKDFEKLIKMAIQGRPFQELRDTLGIRPEDGIEGLARSALADEKVGGVRMLYNERLLQKTLRARSQEENERSLQQLERESDPGKQAELLRRLVQDLNAHCKSAKTLKQVDNLTIISLKTLLDQAEKFRDRWEEAPEEVRKPGNIARIHGFVIDAARGDILILGRREQGMPALDLDDLTVGVRAVWKERNVPMCSLDPDPEDFKQGRAGPQRVRLGGVPKDSSFARVMLDADYAMKKVLFGIDRVQHSDYASYKQLVLKLPDPFTIVGKSSRYWFYPVPVTPGDIQVSSDGKVACFCGGMQALTEQMTLTREGMLGAGKVDKVAEEAADSFSRHLPAIAKDKPIFHRLQLLFDVVLLARLWQEMEIKSPLLDRLCALPYRSVDVPQSYPGVRETFVQGNDRELFVIGGVEMKVAAGRQSWLVLDDADMRQVRARSEEAAATTLAAPLEKLSLRVAEPNLQWARHRPALVALRKLQSSDVEAALAEARKAVEDDPFDAEALSVRALVHMLRGELAEARRDAAEARDLDPTNPLLVSLTARILCTCHAMEGDAQAALAELDQALAIAPNSKEVHLRRGELFATLKRMPEARQEYRKVLEIDPTYAPAYARQALIEVHQGWVARAKSLAQKAHDLNADLLEVKAVLALTELALARVDTAEKLAQEVIKHPACDPANMLLAYTVLITASGSKQHWDRLEEHVSRASQAAPPFIRPQVYLIGANAAGQFGNKTLAAKYLKEAERLAPNLPQIKELRKELEK